MKSKHFYRAIWTFAVVICVLSCFADFLSFKGFSVKMLGISHYLHYEDVSGDVFTTFSAFQSFACIKSRDEGVLTVCGSLIAFEISGILMLLAGFFAVAIGGRLVWYGKIGEKTWIEAGCGPAAYFCGSVAYFLMNPSELLDPQDNVISVSYEIGCFYLVLVNLAQFCLAAGVFYEKKMNLDRYQAFLPPKISQNTEEILIGQGVISEECIGSAKFYQKDLETPLEYHEISEKIRADTEETWLQIAELKKIVLFYTSELQNFKEPPTDEQIAIISSQISQLSKAFLSNEQSKWQFEKQQLLKQVKELKMDLEKTKSFFSKDEISIKAEIEELLNEKNYLKEELKKQENTICRSSNLINYQQAIQEVGRLREESTKRLQEIERLNGVLDNAYRSLKDSQGVIEDLEAFKKYASQKELRYKEKLENMKKSLKEINEAPITENISEIDSEAFNEQLSFITEALKKSKNETSQMENLYQNLESAHKKTKKELGEVNERILKDSEKIKELELELTRVNEKYEKSIRELEGMTREAEENSVIIEKYRGYRVKRKELQGELDLATGKIMDLEQVLEISKLNSEKYISDLRGEFELQVEEWERVKTELVYANNQQGKELEMLHSRMKTQENYFEKELQSLQLSNSLLKDEKSQNEDLISAYKNELSRAKNFEKTIADTLPEDLQKIFAAQNSQVASELRTFAEKLQKQTSSKEKLRKKLQIAESELEKLSEECQLLQKQKYESKNENTVSFTSNESLTRSIHDSLIIEGMSPSIVSHNPLLEIISALRKEPAMTYPTLWKTLELMMLEKGKANRLGDVGKNSAEFLLEFMQVKFGLKTLAARQVKALVTSLEELYKINHSYAVFFCRVFGIFHPKPLPNSIVEYLFIMQETFNQAAAKTKSYQKKLGKAYDEAQQYGGLASIIDVMDLVKKVFKNSREIGERILNGLLRINAEVVEITLAKVCSALQRQNLDAVSMFQVLKANEGVLDYQEFIDGIRINLDIWVPQENIEKLCSYLDEEHSGVIRLEDWEKKVNFGENCEKAYGKEMMVAKSQFLNVLISEYEGQAVEDFYKLKKIVKGNNIDPETASKYLRKIDPKLKLELQEKLFKEALSSSEQLTSEALCLMVLKYGIGGYGRGVFQAHLLRDTP